LCLDSEQMGLAIGDVRLTGKQEVIGELEMLGRMLQEAFGVISQSTVVDFEALFAVPRVEVGSGNGCAGGDLVPGR
jgi:hypothetical protein